MIKGKGSTSNRYTEEEKVQFVEAYRKSGLDRIVFCKRAGISESSLYKWMCEAPGGLKSFRNLHSRKSYDLREKLNIMELFLKSDLSAKKFCKSMPGSPSPTTLKIWVREQKEGTLSDERKRGPKGISKIVKNEIKNVKAKNPEYGARKIRDFLSRFRGVKVASNTVQKTLVEENLQLPKRKKRKRRSSDRVRRFERAKPMQLWQSDITSYLLTRNGVRVYLTVFLDDRSRYIVAWNLHLRQTTDFVVEALLDGIQRFGKPEEVLTDQGRQYFSWRGKSDFQKLLDKQGIKHIVARSHHPQTVGKCERFWETVKEEFWGRVKPQDLANAKERFQHFVNYYNHFRPHQGIDGLVPADRFFGVESELRKALERTHSENELRLATGDRPRTPVFLIGQVGEESISMHGEDGKLVLNLREGRKEFGYGEFGHGNANTGEKREEVTGKTAGALQDSEICVPGESALGTSERGGADPGTRNIDRDNGVLAREENKTPSGESTKNSTNTSLADVTTGDLGYAGGVGSTTKDEGGGDGPEGRSEAPAEKDCGVRRSDQDAGCVDPSDEADAGNSQSEEGWNGTNRSSDDESEHG